jgi:ferritin-like protein
MANNLTALVHALAEQSFMAHILAKRLVELGILKPRELNVLFESSPDKAEYIQDFIRHMASLGLDAK